jgi:hypothetical protein
VQYGGVIQEERAEAVTQLAEYPAGKAIQVFFDPESPDHSVLIKGIGTIWIAAVLGAIALTTGAGTLVYMIRSRGRGQAVPSRRRNRLSVSNRVT